MINFPSSIELETRISNLEEQVKQLTSSSNKKKDVPRRFVPVNGFNDGTKWIEPGVLVFKNGTRISYDCYNLDFCLKLVQKGLWKELPPLEKVKDQVIKEKPEKKVHPVEKNPLVQFYYSSKLRTVRVIAANCSYIIGLDLDDKNRFKRFRQNKISDFNLLEFNLTSISNNTKKKEVIMPRRFVHVDGWSSFSKIKWVEPDCIVFKDGSRMEAPNYPLSQCLHFVNKGSWREMDPNEITYI
jgi:hypothetical protein